MTIVRRRGTAIVDTPKGILVASGRRKIFLLPGGGTERKTKESRRKSAMRELREETGLRAYDSKYLFTYNESKYYPDGRKRKIVNLHKVFLIKAKGHARPRHEVKHIAYYRDNNINLSYNTEKIIEKYLEMKNKKSPIGFLRKILGTFQIPN
ncbi:MAG: NUDIX domain-containing protein [Nanoarchaeota archaeon]|nr:NUDIX domain-containing protein [Nanoarchaeota archaeon]MBU4116356.1 NUDIX domain-containing protein [Nanoarchaeota archaeon]